MLNNKTISLFKTKTTENYSEPTRVNNVHGGQKKPRKQKNKSEDNIIKSISSRKLEILGTFLSKKVIITNQ